MRSMVHVSWLFHVNEEKEEHGHDYLTTFLFIRTYLFASPYGLESNFLALLNDLIKMAKQAVNLRDVVFTD